MTQSRETSPEMAGFRTARDKVILKIEWLSGESVDSPQRKVMAAIFGLMQLLDENEQTLSDQEMSSATTLLDEIITHLDHLDSAESRTAGNKVVSSIHEILAPHLVA
jgi:hypothetical protein